LRRSAEVVPAASEPERVPQCAPGLLRTGKATRYALAGAIGLAASVWLGSCVVCPSDPSTALYKRSAAFVQACEAAGLEIAKLRSASSFLDDCSAPIVTPIFDEEGYVLVRRSVEAVTDDDGGRRVTYSVKMDGRGVDRWHAVKIKRAPSQLTLDVSLLPTTRSAMPTSAQR
jgi:hypothetical protein